MNRVDFMSQLEHLLQSIAPAEREEALQYYNDYFDDAGKENEQEVIEALGNPARVAENIKKDLLGNGYGGEPLPRAQASDRALVEYGKETESGEEASGSSFDDSLTENASSGKNSGIGQSGDRINTGYWSDYSRLEAGSAAGTKASSAWEDQGDRRSVQNTYERPAEKAGMPPWAIALLATLLILASPAVLGLAAALFAVVICWYVVVLCVGVAAVSLLIVLIVLVVTGILCCFVNPWVGLALIGGGLVCGGIGLLFLMLTVAMAGIVTPAFWRSLGRIFRRRQKV